MEYQDISFAAQGADNPYAVAPAENVSLNERQRHDMGNSAAANAEARAVAEVKAQVLMARQFPRDPMQSMERILRECERPTLADQAVYTFPRAKETVSGPSIRLAEVLARNWGNITFGMDVLERRTGARNVGYSVLRAYAWDLETNTYVSRQFELKHWRATRSGGYAITDDRDIYELEANMGSRRMRACILQVVPGDVTQAAVNKCRKVAASGLGEAMKDPRRRADLLGKTVRVFEKIGVTQADLEEYLEARMDDWTADHALRLKELKNSLDDNAISLGDVFPRLAQLGGNEMIDKEQVKTLMEQIAATGRQGEVSAALKKLGIAKVSDVPVIKLDEVKALIAGFAPAKEPEAVQAAPPPAPGGDVPEGGKAADMGGAWS